MDNRKLATVLDFPRQRRPVPEVDLFLPPAQAMKLGRIANDMGVSATYLVNKWVHEGLNREG